jgi:hypothetical protein
MISPPWDSNDFGNSEESIAELVAAQPVASEERLPVASNLALPFGLTRETDASPLIEQSLKELTGRLLLARQNARLSDFHKLWTIEPSPHDPTAFSARFDGRLISGLTLYQFDSEQNVNPSYKVCAYGCVSKNGKHQHLSNPTYVSPFMLLPYTRVLYLSIFRYQRFHQSPPTKIVARCPNFPAALHASRTTDFLRPINLTEFGGVKLFFKYIS